MYAFQRKATAAVAILLSAAGLLTGCGDVPAGQQPTSAGEQVAAPVTTTAPATQPKSSSWTELSTTSASLILSPGAQHKLTVTALAKDGSKKELSGDPQVSYISSSKELASVAADGTIQVSSQARTGSSLQVTVQYQGLKKEIPITVKYALAETITTAAGGSQVVTNPKDVAVVVNKSRALPADYAPPASELVEPNVPFTFKEKSEKKLMRAEAAKALETLFEQAAKEQIKLAGVSAYRSYTSQRSIYANNVKTQGEQTASKYSAKPGQSEHQTGLAIDVSSASAKFALEESFGATTEGKWLAANAHKFGYILRYPKGKESITGYNYEPWHIRYVGVELAKEIKERGITLEEYFQDAIPVTKPKG
jgi:zinc D-Ala-D-Ala carboxypeptidase